MKRAPNIERRLSSIVVVLAALICGCSASTETDGGAGTNAEESGAELTLDESYDDVRNGARLVLAYDAQTNAFHGTVENTTEEKLERVRVEVH